MKIFNINNIIRYMSNGEYLFTNDCKIFLLKIIESFDCIIKDIIKKNGCLYIKDVCEIFNYIGYDIYINDYRKLHIYEEYSDRKKINIINKYFEENNIYKFKNILNKNVNDKFETYYIYSIVMTKFIRNIIYGCLDISNNFKTINKMYLVYYLVKNNNNNLLKFLYPNYMKNYDIKYEKLSNINSVYNCKGYYDLMYNLGYDKVEIIDKNDIIDMSIVVLLFDYKYSDIKKIIT